MPGFSVSCSNKEYETLLKKSLTPSKAFQLGIEVASKGGIDKFLSAVKDINKLQKRIESLEIDLEKEKIRNKNLKEMLNKERIKSIGLSERIDNILKKEKVSGLSKRKKDTEKSITKEHSGGKI